MALEMMHIYPNISRDFFEPEILLQEKICVQIFSCISEAITSFNKDHYKII